MVRSFSALGVALLVVLGGCAQPVKEVKPLAAELRGRLTVQSVEVTLSDTAVEAMRKYDAKAAEKRAERGMDANTATADAASMRRTELSTLPFDQMFKRMVPELLRERGVIGDRAVKLNAKIDTLKFANTGAAMLIGSSDQLSGLVRIEDASSGENLAEFYVDVINSHSGLLGMAMRGGGVREELVEEFAIETSRKLGGEKGK